MQLRREIMVGVGVSLVLQVLVSLLAITLLERMRPEIRRILDENVYSVGAVEEMLAELARTEVPASVTPAFAAALERARTNITEPAERPLLDTIAANAEDAFRGDTAARASAIDALREIGDVNRRSMQVADHDAQQLAHAGAWSTVILGAIGFALGLLLHRRLRSRIERPLQELRDALARVRSGNHQARCSVEAAPDEVRQIAADIDWLLDRMLHARNEQGFAPSAAENELRVILAKLLDLGEPAVIVDDAGRRVATSQDAIDLEPTGDWARIPLGHTPYTLMRRDQPRSG